MPSIIYGSFVRDGFKGDIDLDVDNVWVMICGSGYSENKDHAKRSDITNELSGSGYTAGGFSVGSVTVTYDSANDRTDIVLPAVNSPSVTLTGAQKFVYYKRRGGAATADELICCIDNGTGLNPAAQVIQIGAMTLRFPV